MIIFEICIAGLNRQAGYATVSKSIPCLKIKIINIKNKRHLTISSFQSEEIAILFAINLFDGENPRTVFVIGKNRLTKNQVCRSRETSECWNN